MDNRTVGSVPFPLELSMKISMRLIPYLLACAFGLPAWVLSPAVATPAADPDGMAASDEPARDEASRKAAHAYWQEVAERLLMGQRTEGACPPAREVASCLLAARMLSIGDIRRDPASGFDPPQPERDRVRALLSSVASRSHEDPRLLWAMTWDLFRRESPELRDRAIAELRRTEPDNLQVWLLSSGDESWTPERLKAAANSTRLDARMYDALRSDLERLAEVAVDVPPVAGLDFDPSPVESTQVFLTDLMFAEALPRLHELIDFCGALDSDIEAVALADCWRVAELLTGDAESVIDLALGSSLMRRIARNEVGRERADRARLQYEYLQQGAAEVFLKPGYQRLVMQRMREADATEISALRLSLIDAGLAPEPPSER